MKAGAGKIALAGWCLLAASPSAAITEEIAAGESVSNGSVNSVVTQQVYGETENYSVMGKQEVMSGGVTHNSNIYSYGQQDVLSGGTSFDTLIQYYAVQNVDGKAYASSVNSRGVIDVNAGGYVKSTVVNGGSLFIDEGALAEETVLNSGKVYLSGKDSAAKISGGTYEIKSGGVSEQAQISGGLAQVDSRAAINRAVLSDRGEIEADGTVTDIRIESGGQMTIHDGGTATDTTLSGGEMTLDEEAEAYNTTLLSGTEYVYGTDTGARISGGTQIVEGGGKAAQSIISAGGIQQIGFYGISEDVTVENGGTQQVDWEGTALRTTVSAGGSLEVSAGGTATDTALSAGDMQVAGLAEQTTITGGNLEVSAGGTATDTTLAAGEMQVAGTAKQTTITGGSLEVSAGGTATDTTLSAGNMQVAGSAKQTTITGGSLKVSAGGTATDSTLSAGEMQVAGTAKQTTITGGSLKVSAGGTATDTALSAGEMQVSGTAEQTTITGGSLEVSAGGTATDTALSAGEMQVSGTAEQTTITGGSLEVSAGGTASDTALSAGNMQVAGTAAGVAVNSGGTVAVMSGGNVENMVLNGGTAHINQGGENTAAIVNAGTEYVAGVSRSATLNHNGTQIVQSGGISTGAVVNYAANQQVASGGMSEKAQVTGGTQTVAGTAQNTELIKGQQNILSGGTAENTYITGGTQMVAGTAQNTELMKGQQNILSGGTAENTYITGGIQTIASGAKTINTSADGGMVTLDSGGLMSGKNVLRNATLTINGSNHIADLELENTLLSIAKKPEFSTLQIDNLNGSGLISLSSDLSQNIADKLDVRNGSGEFGLIIHDYSAEGKLPLSFKLIDENAAAADSFYLVGNAVDVGAFKYDLRMDGADWVLQRTQDHTDSAVIAKNTYASLSSLFYAHLTPLYTRLRHTRGEIKHHNGLWAKSFGRKIRFSYKDKTKSTTEAYGAAFGYDGVLWQNNKGSLLAGVFGALSDSRQKYDRNGRGDGKTESLGLYSTWQSADNWFIDIAGTYFWHKQKIKSYTPSGYDVDGKYHTNAYQASLHAGKRWDIGAAWFLEPYVGLNYMRVDSISYRTNFNTLVKADAADYMGGTAGISAGRGITLPNGGNMDIYGRAAVVYDWDGKSPLVVAEEIFMEDTSSVRYELGAGFSASFGSRGTVYADMSTQLGSRVRFPWEFNLGLQFNF